jgi:hypothetical protein
MYSTCRIAGPKSTITLPSPNISTIHESCATVDYAGDWFTLDMAVYLDRLRAGPYRSDQNRISGQPADTSTEDLEIRSQPNASAGSYEVLE